MKITLEDIFNIPTAVIYYPDLYKAVTSVSIDTRTIKKNSLFVAIKGKNFDGHKYVKEAIKKGATAVVVSNRKLEEIDDVKVPIISVRNTVKAYGELAKIWRRKLSAKVISITGSNGKTTTKEMIAHLLSAKYKVHKTLANNNNQIGVPLTILSATKNTEFIVVEHGTNHFGEIEYSAKIAQPDYAVITNIGDSHIKYLNSKKKILREKEELFKNTNKNGIVFINNDDELLRNLIKKYSNHITFGFTKGSDVHAELKGITSNGNPKIKIKSAAKSFDVTLPILGETNALNYLTAVAIVLELGVSKKDILSATKTLTPVKGRLNKIEFDSFTIVDDTYNANPESTVSAIKLLANIRSRKNKIVVLGDMLELGNKSIKLHKDLAKEINKMKNTSVLTIGKFTKELSASLKNTIALKKHFKNRKSLKRFLEQIDVNDSVFLVKGSRGMRMEEFVQTLKGRTA